jgi:hypothetical protein
MRQKRMRQNLKLLITAIAALSLSACATSGIQLADMGSFHVGGREVVITGKPVKEVMFTPGGVPAKVDPNGVYQVEQMYVQYLCHRINAAAFRF